MDSTRGFDVSNHALKTLSWKNIIFLPYYRSLQWGFVLDMFISVIYNIYLFGFDLNPGFYMRLIFETMVEFYFFIYTALLILHRILKSHRQQRMFQPHPTIFLILDVISLAPLSTFFGILNRQSRETLFSEDTVAYTDSYFKLLRIAHLFYFYLELRNDLRNNQTTIILFGHFLISWGIIASFAAVYFHLGNRPSPGANATWKIRWQNVNNASRWDAIDTSKIQIWMFITTYDIDAMFFNNAQRVMPRESHYDMIVTFVTMCIGFFSLYTFVGILITEELTTMRKRFNLQSRLNEALKLMRTFKMPEHYQKTVKDYYEMLWNTRMGYVNLPQTVKSLPLHMQTEVFKNIYHEALLHSPIFSNLSKVYQSMIATAMTTEVYLSGDVILNENDMRSKLMFIESGEIEVSRIHGEKIRIVLTDGSLLSGLSSIRPTICNSNVKCLTNCTLHVLEHARLVRVLRQSPTELQKLRRIVDEHIRVSRVKLERLGDHYKGVHLKFVKAQWRKIVDNPNTTFDKNFTSKYLNIITLVTNEVNSDAFCLSGKCPFGLRRGTKLHKALEYLELACIIFNFFYSYDDIFYQRITFEKYTFYCVVDTLMMFNIFIQIITMDRELENIHYSFSTMLFRKMKSWCFIMDVIAALPYDYIFISIGSTTLLISASRLPKWILLYKVWKYIIRKEQSLNKHYMYLIIIKYFTVYMFVPLILAYAFQLLACYNHECSPLAWPADDKAVFIEKFGYYDPPYVLLNSLNYILNTFMRLNLRVYNDNSLGVVLLRNNVRIAAYYAVTMHLAQFSALFSLRFERYQLYSEYMQYLRIYLTDYKELKQLKDRLMEYMTVKWSVSNMISYRDLSRITCNTDAENDPEDSEYIRKNVKNDYIISILQKTEFFSEVSEEFLHNLATKCDLFIVPEGHRIVESGEYCFYMYVIVDGYCMVQSKTPGDAQKNIVRYYSNCHIIPLIEYLHHVKSFVDVFTDTTVQLLSIPYSTFVVCLSRYPKDKMRIENTIAKHRVMNRGMLANISAPDADEKPTEVNMAVPAFEYQTHSQTLELGVKKKNFEYRSYKKSLFRSYRTNLRKITLTTYSPNTNAYMIYEVFRCVCIILHTNLHYLSIVKTFSDNLGFRVFLYFMDLLWFIDLLIKAHLQYYDEHGLLVKRLRKTVKNYVTSSFTFDLLGGIPLDIRTFFFYVRREDQLRVMLILSLTFRMCLWVRPTFLAIYAIKLNKSGLTFILKCLSLILIYYHLSMQLASYKILLTCQLLDNYEFVCPPESWMNMSKIQFTMDVNDYYWTSVSTLFDVGIEPADRLMRNMDIIIVLITGIIMTITRLTIISGVVGEGCIHGTRLIFHQDNIIRYKKFFRKRFVSNTTKASTINHFTYLWRKCNAESSPSVFDNVYPFLRELLITTMYRKAIRHCILFQGSNEVLFRRFIPYIKQRYYNKDAIIIRPNDIQENLYLITSGEVEILIANTRIAVLTPGSIFGSFEIAGFCRQLILARTTQNSAMVTIQATRFYQVIKDVPRVERIMRYLRAQQMQFATTNEMNRSGRSTFSSLASKRTVITSGNSIRVINLHAYILNIHLAPINALVVLINLSVEFGVHNFIAAYVILDLMFYTVFFYRANVRTFDKKTGNEVTNAHSLRMHYFKSPLFFVDLISSLPLYLLRIWLFSDTIQIFFTCNKLLRIYYTYYHYYHNYNHDNIPRHLNWTMLVYVIIFLFHGLYDYAFIVEGSQYDESMHIMFMGYLYLMNVISMTGFNINRLYTNITKMYSMSALFVLCFGMTLIVTRLYTRSVYTLDAYSCYYRQRANLFMQFCKMSHLSRELLQYTWAYLHYLRRTQGGVQFPLLYAPMPRYLKQDHMQSLFGKLISNHHTFSDLHMDFLKQVQTRIACYYYLPGMIIVQKSHFDNHIYFIIKGSVVAIRHSTDSDMVLYNSYEMLEAGAAFGEFEALLHHEYSRTYQTLTPVQLISIPVNEFMRLLEWFPASKQKILMRMSDYGERPMR